MHHANTLAKPAWKTSRTNKLRGLTISNETHSDRASLLGEYERVRQDGRDLGELRSLPAIGCGSVNSGREKMADCELLQVDVLNVGDGRTRPPEGIRGRGG